VAGARRDEKGNVLSVVRLGHTDRGPSEKDLYPVSFIVGHSADLASAAA
jgi:hypothetical protein